ncbi:hypothetical protein RN001_012746 [Aquatica leii]|uniref:Lipase domain-containing protein n=1 Tax=Aquatica leii TaxID=1421715 RepID=A0AAN7P3P2_9COLE|nr:hypothetical protein RN001_012746 [Aquatica leii]
MRLVHYQVIFLFLKIISGKVPDPFSWARIDKMVLNLPWLPFENETRCYDEIGCLNLTRSWYHLIHRPINVFPLPRSVINTRFILYTRAYASEGEVINAHNDTIQKSNLDVKNKIRFIIHGFIDTPLSNWVSEMKDELLKAEEQNVIVVDWAGGSLPLYTQATANTRLVGLELGYFINYLIKNHDVHPSDVHIIGHSLGAHTAGYAGSMVPGLGRITGLDPAEPYFQGMSSHVRLDPTDAKFVDVIHTDGKSIFFLAYGMSQPCGHIDFYPNNGKEQPGCDITQTPLIPLTLIREGLEEASRVLVACNHVRAIKLFINSINSKCPYIARQCTSYEEFLEGRCFACRSNSKDCALMGYHADINLGLDNEIAPANRIIDGLGTKYFTLTGKKMPFCHRLYRITVQLAKPVAAEDWVQGFLRAAIFSSTGVINIDITPVGDTKLQHGTSYSVVLSHPQDLRGNVKRVDLTWEYDMNVLEPRTICLFWCNNHVYVKSVFVDELEFPERMGKNAQYSNKLCSLSRQGYADIPNRGRAVFLNLCRDIRKSGAS